MKWQQGRAAIDKMLADGELERVHASREHADRLISQARRHLDSVHTTCESDPEGAYGTTPELLPDDTREDFHGHLRSGEPMNGDGRFAQMGAHFAHKDLRIAARLWQRAPPTCMRLVTARVEPCVPAPHRCVGSWLPRA